MFLLGIFCFRARPLRSKNGRGLLQGTKRLYLVRQLREWNSPHLRAFIKAFLADWTQTSWDITTIMAEGDRVMVERLDRTALGEVKVDLPCCGVFVMEDGKIKEWRDYFDLATYTNALTPPEK